MHVLLEEEPIFWSRFRQLLEARDFDSRWTFVWQQAPRQERFSTRFRTTTPWDLLPLTCGRLEMGPARLLRTSRVLAGETSTMLFAIDLFFFLMNDDGRLESALALGDQYKPPLSMIELSFVFYHVVHLTIDTKHKENDLLHVIMPFSSSSPIFFAALMWRKWNIVWVNG